MGKPIQLCWILTLQKVPARVFIRREGKPPELKHLSRARKINQIEIPLVAASENGIV